MEQVRELMCEVQMATRRVGAALKEERAQGTMEYAILVAVLVVVAIAAITAVGPIVGQMWDAIRNGMQQVEGSIGRV